jgi:hypothetical protein
MFVGAEYLSQAQKQTLIEASEVHKQEVQVTVLAPAFVES